jgi:hypothetical protein
MTSKLGHDPWIAQVLGGIARAQWLTTLTGESPTSSRTTLVAGRVTRVDKAQPKRLVDAAVRRSPTRTPRLWGWQLSRCSGDGRDRETQRKETRNLWTMRTVSRPWGNAMTLPSGPPSDT